MTDKRPEKLFKEFEPILKKTWKELALKDLKNEADFDKLIWELEELAIDPFYTLSDLESLKTLDFFNQEILKKSGGWHYLENIAATNPEEANKKALNSLEKGADGVIFELEPFLKKVSEDELKILLDGVLPEHCIVSFKTKIFPNIILNNYFNVLKSKDSKLSPLSGTLDYDPISEWTLTKNEDFLNFTLLKSILEITSKTPKFSGLTISGEVFTNSGASAVQQLALIICELNDYIEELSKSGISPTVVFKNIQFKISIGKNFFIEIAKVRALKLLIYKLAHLYQVPNFDASEIHIHASTAWWTKTVIEPHHNILRNTTEAMAAILGGCNSLSILPHDISKPEPDDFSQRVSRNISNILKEESFHHRISNPADGSYFVEALTEMIVSKTWKLVQDIEDKGGFIKAFKSGYIVDLVKKNYDVQIENTLKSKDKIIGVNYFKDKDLKFEGIENKCLGWFEFDRVSAVIEKGKIL